MQCRSHGKGSCPPPTATGDRPAEPRSPERPPHLAVSSSVNSTTDEAAAAARYEDAEETFLQGVRMGRDRAHLTALADAVAEQAKAWNTSAHTAYPASSSEEKVSLSRVTERTDVLENLWFDIAGAFHGRAALHDG
jgi:hypothetical protein